MQNRNFKSTKLEAITYLPEEEDILIWHLKGLEKNKKRVHKNNYLDETSDSDIKKITKSLSNAVLNKETKLVNKSNSLPVESKTNVFDRLLDPKLYTGIHKYRFDKDGNGLGKPGREYVYREDGYTESSRRRHEVVSTPPIKRYSYSSISSTDTLQKAKVIWLYKNGDKYDKGTIYYVKPYIRNLTQLFNEINRNVRLLGGPVRVLYDQGFKQISSVSEIIDGAKYLCTSGEQPVAIDKLERFLSYWIINQ